MKLLIMLSSLILSSSIFAEIPWKNYSESELSAASQSGKKVILGFHKKGCSTCHSQDSTLYRTGITNNKNIVFLKVARKDELLTKVYEKYGFNKRQWASLVLLEKGKELTRVSAGVTDKKVITNFANKAI